MLASLPMYMMIGIILVIGISQFNRIAGGILGLVFWTAVAIIGTRAYQEGGAIGIPGFRFPKEAFWLLCAVFGGFSGFTAYIAYVKKTRFRPPPASRDDSTTGED